ncbi:MAG: diaminopimelate decarboxylase [Actinomycetia bacterium]|nr:diaminopimelate decarboxylase [Actinomycetes bacterium]
MTEQRISQHLLPDSASILDGRLVIGGCDVEELTRTYGTPLFVYDEDHIRARCREAVAAFDGKVAYASKAFLCTAMAKLVHEEGMAIDVSTGGELFVALHAGVPPGSLVLHGNNKSESELTRALEVNIGRIVVDSWDEIRRIEQLVEKGHDAPRVLIRVNPGIEAHTHEYLKTGVADSKFGFPMADGVAADAISYVRESPSFVFLGVHAHIGSQVFDAKSYAMAIDALAPFVVASGASEFSIGGGLGVAYVSGESSVSIADWAAVVKTSCLRNGIDAIVHAEPGRSIVASSAVTAYTVGTVKTIPGVRTYVAVDGGMSDNPRPVLYGSGYEAFRATDADAERSLTVHIVGKHCESGDIIIRDAAVPADLAVGDILCTPVTGAYGHAMGSNYNKVLRPAVVFVARGKARLVIERESYSALISRDVG